MIIEYHRPDELKQALKLLARDHPQSVPLGGGSTLNRPGGDPVAVVDLQKLGLDGLERRGNFIELGAALTLQHALESGLLPPALEKATRHEAAYNLRQVGTIAGTLIAAGGRSPFATAMLALDAVLTLAFGTEGETQDIGLGDLLPLRKERLRGRLVTRVTIPANVRLAYEYVARTPADQPIVCAAVAQWPSGRTRVALGGFGAAPSLALDGGDASGIRPAAANAYRNAGDQWASAEYRSEIAAVLAQRGLDRIHPTEETGA